MTWAQPFLHFFNHLFLNYWKKMVPLPINLCWPVCLPVSTPLINHRWSLLWCGLERNFLSSLWVFVKFFTVLPRQFLPTSKNYHPITHCWTGIRGCLNAGPWGRSTSVVRQCCFQESHRGTELGEEFLRVRCSKITGSQEAAFLWWKDRRN